MKIPEKCKLVAYHTGDAWSLEVHRNYGDDDDELVAYLDWPKTWPEYMKTETLKQFGFEIV